MWPVCYIPPGKLPVCFDDLSMHNSVEGRTVGERDLTRDPLRGGFHGPLSAFERFGGLVMTIAGLKSRGNGLMRLRRPGQGQR